MAYQVLLKKFEGPLDLLLHLIEKAEVDIRDIFVSEITAQYIDYINSAEDLDMDTASEFVAMAARLLFIKSRSLLPKPPKEIEWVDAEEEEDPEELLIRQLREYKAFKNATAMLYDIGDDNTKAYAKLPEEFILPEQETVFIGGTRDELFRAFCEVLKRVEAGDNLHEDYIHEVVADAYTTRGCMSEIRTILREKSKVTFEELFYGRRIKLHVIVMFMALLEMLMRDEVTLFQDEPFATIFIVADKLREDDDDSDEGFFDEEA